MEERARGVAGRQVGVVDHESPGQIGRAAKELLVEVIAQASDRLSYQDARRQGVGKRSKAQASPMERNVATQGTSCDSSPDAKSAFPDPQRLERIAVQSQ